MNKILVVQPDRMLQQAFMMALFPDHDVQMVDALPKVTPKDFDAMIVDTAALREHGSLTGRDLKLLQSFDVPLLLIEADGEDEIEGRANLVRLKRPVVKENLRKALADSLAGAAAAKVNLVKPTVSAPKVKSKSKKQKDTAPAHPQITYIELIDVVEEGGLIAAGTMQALKKI